MATKSNTANFPTSVMSSPSYLQKTAESDPANYYLWEAYDITRFQAEIVATQQRLIDLGLDSLDVSAAATKIVYVNGSNEIDVTDTIIVSGTTATVGAGKTLDVSAGTLTRADAQIAWAKVSKSRSSIEDLADVNAMTPADGDILIWDNGNSRWDTGAVFKATTTTCGFFGVTLVAQQAHIADATQTQDSLTDNSGGTAGTTIAAITDTNNAGSADVTPTKDAVASLAAQLAKVKTDVADTNAKVAAILDALEAYGLLATV